MKGFGAGRVLAAAAAALLTACAIGCVPCDSCGGDKDTTMANPGGSTGGGGTGGGGVPGLNIACSEGQAWVACASGQCNALIFKPAGELVVANKKDDGVWYIDYYNCGAYSVNGNRVTITYAYGASTRAYIFNVTGITLTAAPTDGSGSNLTFTKTAGIYPIGVDSPASGGVSPVCADGEAWVFCENGRCDAAILKPNGDFFTAYVGTNSYWYYNEGNDARGAKYAINGNKLTIFDASGTTRQTITFGISENTVTAVQVVNGQTVYTTATKTGGIYPISPGSNGGGGGGHVHQWSTWTITVPATCQSRGIVTRVCALDPTHIETVATVPLSGEECEEEPGNGGGGGGGGGTHVHTYGDWTVTVQPTCTAPGLMTRTCTLDGFQETQQIPQLTGATCNSGGGGDEPHIHTFGAWEITTQATCTAPGLMTRTCTLDGFQETLQIPQLTGAQCNSGGGSGSYDYVTLGGKKWMKTNMNVSTPDSWCYENDNTMCNKYGRLYTWSAAKSVCQSVGWRLPDTADWRRLVEAAGGYSTAAKALKTTSGWSNYATGNGTDTYGFSALPAGFHSTGYSTTFSGVGSYGYWWTATVESTSYGHTYAYYRNMTTSSERVYENDSDVEEVGYSVRCITD